MNTQGTLLTEEFRERWAKAVETYERGTGCLRNADDQFCCLGVAVDLIAPDTWLQVTRVGNWLCDTGTESARGGYLPKSILDKIGLSGVTQTDLSNVNDQRDTTREDMAAAIRALPARPTPTE